MTTRPAAAAPVPTPPPVSDAQTYLAHPRFHQTFTLPATASHGALVFSYADAGREGKRRGRGEDANENEGGGGGGGDDDDDDDEDIPTVLLIPGMFASRFMATWPAVHAVAARMGVRVLAVDRPGMGASSAVPLAQRVPVWLELVPALLRHLGVRHVALVSHSAGTIYALNTLYRCRDVLHPERPLAALLGPFIDTAASRKRDIQLLQWIPAPAFAVWNRIPQFVQTTAQGPLALSGAALESLRGLVAGRGRDDEATMTPGRARVRRHAQRLARVYGVADDAAAADALAAATVRALFAEDTRGANDEARLCLKKGPPGLWGACDDYAAFVRALAAQERERRHRQEVPPPSLPKLRVHLFFAASDAMSGASGQTYMEACWQDAQPGGALADVLQVATATVADTDHDGVASDLATLESVFAAAGGVRPDADAETGPEAQGGAGAEANGKAGARGDAVAGGAGNEE